MNDMNDKHKSTKLMPIIILLRSQALAKICLANESHLLY